MAEPSWSEYKRLAGVGHLLMDQFRHVQTDTLQKQLMGALSNFFDTSEKVLIQTLDTAIKTRDSSLYADCLKLLMVEAYAVELGSQTKSRLKGLLFLPSANCGEKTKLAYREHVVNLLHTSLRVFFSAGRFEMELFQNVTWVISILEGMPGIQRVIQEASSLSIDNTSLARAVCWSIEGQMGFHLLDSGQTRGISMASADQEARTSAIQLLFQIISNLQTNPTVDELECYTKSLVALQIDPSDKNLPVMEWRAFRTGSVLCVSSSPHDLLIYFLVSVIEHDIELHERQETRISRDVMKRCLCTLSEISLSNITDKSNLQDYVMRIIRHALNLVVCEMREYKYHDVMLGTMVKVAFRFIFQMYQFSGFLGATKSLLNEVSQQYSCVTVLLSSFFENIKTHPIEIRIYEETGREAAQLGEEFLEIVDLGWKHIQCMQKAANAIDCASLLINSLERVLLDFSIDWCESMDKQVFDRWEKVVGTCIYLTTAIMKTFLNEEEVQFNGSYCFGTFSQHTLGMRSPHANIRLSDYHLLMYKTHELLVRAIEGFPKSKKVQVASHWTLLYIGGLPLLMTELSKNAGNQLTAEAGCQAVSDFLEQVDLNYDHFSPPDLPGISDSDTLNQSIEGLSKIISSWKSGRAFGLKGLVGLTCLKKDPPSTGDDTRCLVLKIGELLQSCHKEEVTAASNSLIHLIKDVMSRELRETGILPKTGFAGRGFRDWIAQIPIPAAKGHLNPLVATLGVLVATSDEVSGDRFLIESFLVSISLLRDGVTDVMEYLALRTEDFNAVAGCLLALRNLSSEPAMAHRYLNQETKALMRILLEKVATLWPDNPRFHDQCQELAGFYCMP